MKASIEWLKEYSDIDIEATKLGDILTMTGSKVETIDQLGNDIENVVVGKILEIEKHPDADKLVVTKVDVGTEKLQIVTGANNSKRWSTITKWSKNKDRNVKRYRIARYDVFHRRTKSYISRLS